MDYQEARLVVLLFGGHVLSGLLGLVLLLPYFRYLPRRTLLSLALLMTPAGLGYLFLFDLQRSGRYLPAALPQVLTAVFFVAFAVLAWQARAISLGRALFVAALLIPVAWGHFLTVNFVHRCFLGACA